MPTVNVRAFSHKKSTVVENGGPKLPTAAQLELGEIAINFAKGYETLSIKNNNDEIVTFTNDNYWINKELAIAAALNDLNDRKQDALEMDEIPTEGSENVVTSGGLYSYITEIEQVTAAALNDLNDRITSLALSDNYAAAAQGTPPLAGDTYEEAISKLHGAILENELATSGALNDLNTRISDIVIPELILSEDYEPSSLSNDDLFLAPGDSYETAFAKLEKTINDNENITSAALTDLDSRLNLLHLPQSLDDIPDGSTRKLSDYATTTLLATKQDTLVSGTNIKTINNQSLLGSGNITIQGGSGGDTNIIETVKVNGTALTPDANKAVNVTVPTKTSDLTNDSGFLTSYAEIDPTVLSWAKNTIDFLNYVDEPSSGTKLIFNSNIFKNSTAGTNIFVSLKTDGNSIIDGVLDETSDTYPWNNSSLHVLATNRFLQPIIDAKAPSQSPTFTGTPKAPTAATGTNTTLIATTAFVQQELLANGGEENIIETVKVDGVALTPDANKAVNITSVPASIVTQDTTHRFVSDTEKTTWNGKQNALLHYTENSGNADIDVYSSGEIELSCLDDVTAWNRGRVLVSEGGVELNYKDGYAGTDDEIEHTVTLNHEGFKFDNKQIATVDQIPSAVTESTVSGWGFTKNAGTITGITMNGSSKGTSGVVDLGTVLTSHQSIKTLNTNNTTAQTANASETIVGSGIINLHKIAKTGSYSDLIGAKTKLSEFTNDSSYIANNTFYNTITLRSTNTVLNSEDIIIQTGANKIELNPTGLTYRDNKHFLFDDAVITTDIEGGVDAHWSTLNDSQLLSAAVIKAKLEELPAVNNATLTIQKNGTTVGTFTANASSNATANILVNELPTVSSSDNGKILQVVNGAWALVTPTSIYSGTSEPDSNTGNNGDLYLQTS